MPSYKKLSRPPTHSSADLLNSTSDSNSGPSMSKSESKNSGPQSLYNIAKGVLIKYIDCKLYPLSSAPKISNAR